MLDKVRGSLFGVACGDALGATLEFMDREEVRTEYGELRDIVGGGHWQLEPGEVTDDTSLTLAVGYGIVEEPDNPLLGIGEHFIKWFQTNPPDIGGTTKLALELFSLNGDWGMTAEEVFRIRGEHSAGNGSLMRTAPVTLAYAEKEYIREISKKQSLLTHPHPEALKACEIYCLILHEILEGKDLKQSIWEVLNKEDNNDTYQSFLNETSIQKLEANGYVVNTLRSSLWCLLNTSSFEEAVVKVVNLGQDADTTGAVTGGLAGAFYGYEAIPKRWKSVIRRRGELLQLAEKILKVRNE